MEKSEMAPWEDERQLVLHRINELDKKFDWFDDRLEKMQQGIDARGKQIDELRVDVLKIVMEGKADLGLFKKEFQLKNISRAYLGTILAIATAVAGYFLKNLFM